MIIENAKLVKLLSRKKEIVDIGRKVDKELTKMSKEQEKRIAEIKKIDGQASNILWKQIKPLLKEWEEPRKFELKNGKIEVEIVNVIEEFKENYKEQLKKLKNK